jgi:hypothetical protein
MHYHISSLNYPVSKSFTNFVHNLSLFDNELIKHNPREHEMLCMRSKLWCFTRYTSKCLSNYTQSLCQDLQKQEWVLTMRPYRKQASGHELRYEMKLSKFTISIKTPISTRINIYKLARHHLKESNKDSRRMLCQTLTYATKNSVCTSE